MKIYVRRTHGEHRHGSGLVVTTRWQGIDAAAFPDTLVTSDPAIEVETEAEHRARRKRGADPEPTEEAVATEPAATEEGES
jgi:hypothetical protein